MDEVVMTMRFPLVVALAMVMDEVATVWEVVTRRFPFVVALAEEVHKCSCMLAAAEAMYIM